MAGEQALEGSCSCGRFTYVVMLPKEHRDQAQVFFQTDNANRRSQAALLTAFLKVPLTWYTSNTISFFPDETHNSISRTFSPVDEPHCQRKFCGYCGTHLSYWTEQPREEQDFMQITLGSLRNRDLAILQDLDLLPEDMPFSSSTDKSVATNPSAPTVRTIRHSQEGPMTWFEEMLDGSHLGRTRKTRRGMGTSADGTTSVSWEVTEYGDEDEEMVMAPSPAGSKRKHGDVLDDDKAH